MCSGYIRREAGATEAALVLFNKAIAKDPKLAEAYNRRGNLVRALGRLDEAISDHSKSIELQPKTAVYYEQRGSDYIAVGQLEKALADLNKSIELRPKWSYPYAVRGVVKRRMGKYREALADFKRAIELDPYNDYAYYVKAWLLATSRDASCRSGAEALEDARKAYRLTFQMKPNYFRAVAAAYAELGEFDKAIEWQHFFLKHPKTKPSSEDQEISKLFEKKEPIRE